MGREGEEWGFSKEHIWIKKEIREYDDNKFHLI
jgi:hypothetical protein